MRTTATRKHLARTPMERDHTFANVREDSLGTGSIVKVHVFIYRHSVYELNMLEFEAQIYLSFS